MNLHTRSAKYGLLTFGTLLRVNNKLIKRQKHHFCKIDNTNVHVILSHNGNVWFSSILGFILDVERNQIINDVTLNDFKDSIQNRD